MLILIGNGKWDMLCFMKRQAESWLETLKAAWGWSTDAVEKRSMTLLKIGRKYIPGKNRKASAIGMKTDLEKTRDFSSLLTPRFPLADFFTYLEITDCCVQRRRFSDRMLWGADRTHRPRADTMPVGPARLTWTHRRHTPPSPPLRIKSLKSEREFRHRDF